MKPQTLEELKAELRKKELERDAILDNHPNALLPSNLMIEMYSLVAKISTMKDYHVEEMLVQLKKAQELLKGLASVGHSYATILVAENNELLAKLEGCK